MPITYQIVGCTNPMGAQDVDYATNRQLKRVPSELSRKRASSPKPLP